MAENKIGVKSKVLSEFKKIVEDRKEQIRWRKMANKFTPISRGFEVETVDEFGEIEFYSFNSPCVLKIEKGPPFKIKIFRQRDEKRRVNLLANWGVPYLNKGDVTKYGDTDANLKDSVQLLVNPMPTNRKQRSKLILKCFNSEWMDVNSAINSLLQNLPTAATNEANFDSRNSSTSPEKKD